MLANVRQHIRQRLFDAIDGYRASGGLVAFDSNYRPHLWNDAALARRETAAIWARTDIALPSLDDEVVLFGEKDEAAVLDRLRSAGVNQGALKRGTVGPLDLGPEGAALDVSPAPNVVDTTAAGDSFNAGYLAALSKGLAPEASMAIGHALAVQVIAKPGAIVDVNPELLPWPN